MGSWKSAGSAQLANDSSLAQRNMIKSLREQIDGVSPGTYADDPLRTMTSLEAHREIDKLRARIDSKKKTYPCPFCFKKPCAKEKNCQRSSR